MANTYINYSVKTKTQLVLWLMTKLGGGPYGQITLPITDGQWDAIVNEATEYWSKWAYWQTEEMFLAFPFASFVKGRVNVYDIHPELDSRIVSLYLPSFGGSFSGAGLGGLTSVGNAGNAWYPDVAGAIGNVNGAPGYSGPAGSGGLPDLFIAKQYMDIAKDLLGAEPMIEFNEHSGILYCVPNPDKNLGQRDTTSQVSGELDWSAGALCCAARIIQEEDAILGDDWVKRYALACTKEVLGNMRDMFGDVKLPGGANIPNGLSEKALEEKERLQEELREMAPTNQCVVM